MIRIDHHTPTDLTAEEKRQIIDARQRHDAYVFEAMQALRSISYPGTSYDAVVHAVAVLKQEDPSRYSQLYITGGSPSRSRSGVARIADGPHSSRSNKDDENNLNTTSSRGRSPMREAMQNDAYETRLALREEPEHFEIPVNRPLPLSYAAQCDRRFIAGTHRRCSIGRVSDFAPLFTHRSQPMSDSDKERLGFLEPEQNSPKEQTLHLLEERHKYDRKCPPNGKILYNQPKELPDLHRKVDGEFMPECVDKRTESANMHFYGNYARILQANQRPTRPIWLP